MDKNKIRILAIDDNSDNLISLKALIKEAFPDSIRLTAENGAAGIELALTEDPDVILLDVVMPGMDGFKVCQKLKADPKTRDIPVVFLTALKGGKESRIHALEVGGEAFLAKPIDEAELTAQVRAMLRIKNANDNQRNEKEQLAKLVKEQTRELEQVHIATLNLLNDLTEENKARKRNEEGLRESEQSFRALAENSGDYIMRYDHEHRHVYANPLAIQSSGKTSAEYIGKTHREMGFSEDLCALWETAIDKVFATGQPYGEVFKWESIEGAIFLDWRLFPEVDSQGRVIYVLGVSRDITGRKQAEQALAQQNNALLILNRFSIELSMLSSEDNLEALIVRQIKEITGAEVAIFSEYNPADRTTTVQHIEMKPELLQKVVSLLGKQVRNIHSVVSDEMYREMTSEIIGGRKTLYDMSFGAIPRPIGAAIQALLKVDRFIGIAYLIEGKLYGTSVLGMSKDQPDPPREILKNLIFLASLSLRRKRAEEVLRESEEKYKSLHESAGVGIAYYSLDGKVISYNLIAARYMGGTPEEFTGKSIYELFPSSNAEVYMDRIRKAAASNEIQEYEDKVELPGGVKWFVSAFTRIFNSSNQVIGVQIISSDISKNKQAEDALKRERQRLDSIIKGTNVGTWEWNVQTGETIFNDRWAEIIGYSLDEISPVSIKTWMNYAHPDDLIVSGELLDRHFRGEIDYYEFESRMKHKDGNWVWVLDRGKVTSWTGDGKPLMMMGTHQDITERKQAELSLQESEARFKAISEYSHNAICLIDVRGKIIWINEAFIRMGGYSKDQIYASASFIDYIAPESIEFVVNNFTLFVKNEPYKHHYNYYFISADGEKRLCEKHMTDYADQLGNRILAISIVDITDRKLAEEKINEQLEELRRWHNITLGREDRILELKREVNRLLVEAGSLPRYASAVEIQDDKHPENNVFYPPKRTGETA